MVLHFPIVRQNIFILNVIMPSVMGPFQVCMFTQHDRLTWNIQFKI
jgi:hypothetical protein